MIKLHEIEAGYGREKILNNIECIFHDKEITAIVGMNGCGKSTLLKVIAGLLKPKKGQIIMDGVYVETMTEQVRAQKISYLPQNRNTPVISVERMVLHGRFPYLSYPRIYKEVDKRIAREAMERVGILELRSKNMSELSGGERQKVYIAMALAQDTQTILFDEPTTFLDITYQLEILKLISELKQEGKSVITVIHDISAALVFADQMIVMDKGEIKLTAAPEKIYESGILEQVFKVKPHSFLDKSEKVHYYFT